MWNCRFLQFHINIILLEKKIPVYQFILLQCRRRMKTLSIQTSCQWVSPEVDFGSFSKLHFKQNAFFKWHDWPSLPLTTHPYTHFGNHISWRGKCSTHIQYVTFAFMKDQYSNWQEDCARKSNILWNEIVPPCTIVWCWPCLLQPAFMDIHFVERVWTSFQLLFLCVIMQTKKRAHIKRMLDTMVFCVAF